MGIVLVLLSLWLAPVSAMTKNSCEHDFRVRDAKFRKLLRLLS